jgi:hypothetical protein
MLYDADAISKSLTGFVVTTKGLDIVGLCREIIKKFGLKFFATVEVPNDTKAITL